MTERTKTLVITHDHCALHNTRQTASERPKRLKWVMGALQTLQRDIEHAGLKDLALVIREVKTSEPMLAALAEGLQHLASTTAGSVPVSLARSFSVGYLEEKILPAVRAVHTQGYIARLASTCVSLMDKADGAKANIDDDTVVSASSLSAALCAVLSCCCALLAASRSNVWPRATGAMHSHRTRTPASSTPPPASCPPTPSQPNALPTAQSALPAARRRPEVPGLKYSDGGNCEGGER